MKDQSNQVNKSVVHMRGGYNNLMHYKEPGEPVPIPAVKSNTNEYILDQTESTSNTQSKRYKMNIRRYSISYRNLNSNLSPDSRGVCSNS